MWWNRLQVKLPQVKMPQSYRFHCGLGEDQKQRENRDHWHNIHNIPSTERWMSPKAVAYSNIQQTETQAGLSVVWSSFWATFTKSFFFTCPVFVPNPNPLANCYWQFGPSKVVYGRFISSSKFAENSLVSAGKFKLYSFVHATHWYMEL